VRWTLSVIALILISLTQFSSGQAAQPVIASVSGAVANRASITINGSLLVSEDKSHYDSWFTSHPNASGMDGANPNADGWFDLGLTFGSYVTSPKLTGTKSVKLNFTSPSGAEAGESIVFAPNVTTNVYLRTYVQMHRNSASGWFGGQRKMIGYYSAGDTVIMAPADGSEWGPNWDFFYGSSFHALPNPYGNLAPDHWYCIEWYTSNSGWTVWVDGIQVLAETSGGGVYGNGNYYHFGLFSSTSTPGLNMDFFFDNMVTGSARLYPLSKVEIGNSSDYATATKRYQAPTLLSDGQVQVTCDLTGLGNGPYYLWVTNNQQQRSAAFPLSATGAPAMPKNVVVR